MLLLAAAAPTPAMAAQVADSSGRAAQLRFWEEDRAGPALTAAAVAAAPVHNLFISSHTLVAYSADVGGDMWLLDMSGGFVLLRLDVPTGMTAVTPGAADQPFIYGLQHTPGTPPTSELLQFVLGASAPQHRFDLSAVHAESGFASGLVDLVFLPQPSHPEGGLFVACECDASFDERSLFQSSLLDIPPSSPPASLQQATAKTMCWCT